MIVAEEVHYRYEQTAPDGKGALNGIHLSIADGEFLAILGPNGSGKSTLGQCLNGLRHPQAGRITVDDFDPANPDHAYEVFRRVGMIFQNPDNQLVSTTLERELAFGLENLGLPTPEIRERVAWGLAHFHLSDYRFYPPHRLSGGQKQRLAIAAVVLMQPRYIVCDEPTALLDPAGRRAVLALLKTLRREQGISIVYITQIPEEAAGADRVIVMNRGEMVAQGAPQTVLTSTVMLTDCGLEPPLTVQLAKALRTRGLPAPHGAITPEDFVQALRGWVARPGEMAPAAPRIMPVETPPGSPCVDFQNVSYIYRPGAMPGVHALNGVNLCIYPGELVGLIGPNGSGKSTLMQHLNGLLMPASGSVRIDGHNIADRKTDLTAIRRQTGLIFQFPETQLFEETVYADVAFGPRNTGASEEDIRERVYQALDRVQLDPERYAGRYPLALSGGEKRRVAIAGVLAMRPRLLALDEPTAGLDAAGARMVEAILRQFHAEGGTILLISHDMDLIARLAQRVIVLDAGRITADAPPETVFADASWLAALGLDLPPLARLLVDLRAAGFPVDADRYDVESAADEIARHLQR